MAEQGEGGASPSPTPTPSEVARPLQVVVVSSVEDEDPITLNEPALEVLQKSLARLREEHGELPLVIQSAAGAFREGKSFILDCFLRYLHHRETTSEEDLVLEEDVESSFLSDCNLMDPLEDGSVMFESRNSIDRVTSGIWIYSRPFVITTAAGEKVAVLLMDTQGLFDTAARGSLDAPIFALSVLLSSKQIINKRGQFNTNDWQLLNLFTEFSHEIVRRLHRGRDHQPGEVKAFQHLEFLARDFQNFELSMADVGETDESGRKITTEVFLSHCTESSNQYLDRMTAQMSQYHSTVSDRIQDLYTTISCTCLSHPGEGMVSRRWKGDANVLSDTFRALTARYCRNTFANPAIKTDVLGKPMTSEAFIDWVREFTQCMVRAVENGGLPDIDEMVKVVTEHQLTVLQEEAIELAKKEFTENTKDGTKHLPDEELEELIKNTRRKSISLFKEGAQFGPEELIALSSKMLEEKIDEVERNIRDRNKLAMTQILVGFAPYASVAVFLYFLDWISDWVCDSWFDVCVTGSTLMSFYYTIFFVTLLAYMGLKWKTYGPQGLWAAIGPLAVAVSTHFETVVEKAKTLAGVIPTTGGEKGNKKQMKSSTSGGGGAKETNKESKKDK